MADAKADSWSTIDHAYDKGRSSTLARVAASTVQGGVFRVRAKAPKGQATLSGHLTCYYSEDDTSYGERDVAWSWRSGGYHHPWHRQRMPQVITLGPIHEPNAVRCVFTLSASGRGGQLRVQLQRYTGPYFGWSTIAHASDTGGSATLAHIERTIPVGMFRARVKAPQGRAELSGSLTCPGSSDTGHRDVASSWRSGGFSHAWHLQRLPVRLTDWYSYCDVTLDASGKGGRLTFQLQQFVSLFP